MALFFGEFHAAQFLHFLQTVDEIENVSGAEIEVGFGDPAIFQRFFYLGKRVVFFGHAEVERCFQRLEPVVAGAPVRNHDALKTERVAQNFFQQIAVFGSVNAVDLVITAHDRGGLRLHGEFKRL